MPRVFADDNNRVASTVADAWTDVGSSPHNCLIEFQGVYWNGSATKYLKIRNRHGDEIYNYVSDGTAIIDLLPSPLTVAGPLQYYTDEAAKAFIIHGKIQ